MAPVYRDPVQYVRSIVQGMVDHPDDVRVSLNMGTITVTAHPADMGKVIGVNGRTARALRLILQAFALTRSEVQSRSCARISNDNQLPPYGD